MAKGKSPEAEATERPIEPARASSAGEVGKVGGRRLKEFLKFPPDVRSNVGFLVELIDKLPEGRYKKGNLKAKTMVGYSQLVVIPELLKRTKKSNLARLVNIIFFGYKKLEKYVELHWHVDDYGRINYFTLPQWCMESAREYNKLFRRVE